MHVLRNVVAASLWLVAAAPAALAYDPIAEHTAPDFPEGEAERAAILALREANNRAIAARDLDGIMRIAADDYVLVAGGDSIIRTAAEMRARWTATFAVPTFAGCVRTPRNVEVGEQGGTLRAAESGDWRCTGYTRDGQVFGSYFAHWTKRSGEWRVVSDNYVTLGCRGDGC